MHARACRLIRSLVLVVGLLDMYATIISTSAYLGVATVYEPICGLSGLDVTTFPKESITAHDDTFVGRRK